MLLNRHSRQLHIRYIPLSGGYRTRSTTLRTLARIRGYVPIPGYPLQVVAELTVPASLAKR